MFRKTIRVIAWGGLGDVLLSTPSFEALKEKYPASKIVVYYPSRSHRDIYKHNPNIDRMLKLSLFTHPWLYVLHRFKLAKISNFLYGGLLPSMFYKKNAKEIIAEMLGVNVAGKPVQVFLTKDENNEAKKLLNLYKNPVIIHITSLSSKNQEWGLSNWSTLIDALPQYTFIQVGLPKEDQVPNAVDFRGKTSFRQTLALLKHAKGFVGIPSSFSHATNAFNTPGVVLFGGSSTPAVWGHTNNINLYDPPRCSPCIDLLYGSKCPYGRECMNNITVETVKRAVLEKIPISYEK